MAWAAREAPPGQQVPYGGKSTPAALQKTGCFLPATAVSAYPVEDVQCTLKSMGTVTQLAGFQIGIRFQRSYAERGGQFSDALSPLGIFTVGPWWPHIESWIP